MHDDVNDVGRNPEYTAGGVIWPTPLLLYISQPVNFQCAFHETYVTTKFDFDVGRKNSKQSEKFVINSLASARSLLTKAHPSQTYHHIQLKQ